MNIAGTVYLFGVTVMTTKRPTSDTEVMMSLHLFRYRKRTALNLKWLAAQGYMRHQTEGTYFAGGRIHHTSSPNVSRIATSHFRFCCFPTTFLET
jgi:hypothetical protein